MPMALHGHGASTLTCTRIRGHSKQWPWPPAKGVGMRKFARHHSPAGKGHARVPSIGRRLPAFSVARLKAPLYAQGRVELSL